jgi:RimJ/RimL family protein N-acetyltransferase
MQLNGSAKGSSSRLERLLADVDNGNAASEHILLKFGFKYVSQEVIPATGRVLHFYELKKSAWETNPIEHHD